MVSSSFFRVLTLFASYIFLLQPGSICGYPELSHSSALRKRIPENTLCAEGQDWNSRFCNGEVNELAWVDECWDPEAEEWVQHEGECEGGFICTDTQDDDEDQVIECIQSEGDITDVEDNGSSSSSNENVNENDGNENWQDGNQEEVQDENAEEEMGGQVIDVGPEYSNAKQVPHTVVRFMNKTIIRAAFTVTLLSLSKDYIVVPKVPISATVGNIQRPLCTWNAARRRCEPNSQVTLWHGDRITINFSLVVTQAVYLVFTIFGPKAHAPTTKSLLLERGTDFLVGLESDLFSEYETA